MMVGEWCRCKCCGDDGHGGDGGSGDVSERMVHGGNGVVTMAMVVMAVVMLVREWCMW